MASQKNSRRPGSGDLDRPWVPGDSIPAPEAIEGGDTAWALWSEASAQQDRHFAKTMPATRSMRTTNPSWEPTQPAARAPARVRESQPLFTLDAAMLVARKNNRVSPRPERWNELYSLLPARKTLRGQQLPPAPPTGAAWAVTPPLSKRLCFREHIEWAERQGVLETVMHFMQTMREDDWLHMGED